LWPVVYLRWVMESCSINVSVCFMDWIRPVTVRRTTAGTGQLCAACMKEFFSYGGLEVHFQQRNLLTESWIITPLVHSAYCCVAHCAVCEWVTDFNPNFVSHCYCRRLDRLSVLPLAELISSAFWTLTEHDKQSLLNSWNFVQLYPDFCLFSRLWLVSDGCTVPTLAWIHFAESFRGSSRYLQTDSGVAGARVVPWLRRLVAGLSLRSIGFNARLSLPHCTVFLGSICDF
jgi:hypothetical protein